MNAAIPKLSYADEDERDVHNAPTAVRTVRELVGMGYDVSEPDSRVRVDSANEVEQTQLSPSAPALAAARHQPKKKSFPPVTSRIREVCESDSLPREPTAFANLQEMLDSVPPPPVSQTIRPPRNVSGSVPRTLERVLDGGTIRMDRSSLPKIKSIPVDNTPAAVVETPALVPEAVQAPQRGVRSEVLSAFVVVVGSGVAYFALHHFALLP